MSQLPVPGWYVDPLQSGHVRWWDGNQWTRASRPWPQAEEPRRAPLLRAAKAPLALCIVALVALVAFAMALRPHPIAPASVDGFRIEALLLRGIDPQFARATQRQLRAQAAFYQRAITDLARGGGVQRELARLRRSCALSAQQSPWLKLAATRCRSDAELAAFQVRALNKCAYDLVCAEEAIASSPQLVEASAGANRRLASSLPAGQCQNFFANRAAEARQLSARIKRFVKRQHVAAAVALSNDYGDEVIRRQDLPQEFKAACEELPGAG